jgi:hypothetical protein
LAQEINMPVGQGRPHQSGERINDGTEIILHFDPFSTIASIR